jgi:hypothetical protein
VKKVIEIFAVSCFLINITSCFSYKTLTSQEEFSKYSGNKKIDVLYVRTKQDSIIEFKNCRGKIFETDVAAIIPLKLRFKYGDEDSIIFSHKVPNTIDSIIVINRKIKSIWKNGINYKVIKKNKLGYICNASDTIKIPLSDIEELRFRKYKKTETTLLMLGTGGVVIGICIWYMLTQFTIYPD